MDEEFPDEGSALQSALEQVMGETAAGVIVDAREDASLTFSDGNMTLICVGIVIFALGSFFKGLKGGPIHVATENFFEVWREEKAERRRDQRPRRKPEDQPQED